MHEKRNEAPPAEPGRAPHGIADAIPHMVWVAGPDGEAEYHNLGCLEYGGVAQGDTLGSGWARMVHPEDRPGTFAAWGHSLRTGDPFQVDYRLRRHDGAYRWHTGRARAQREADGRVVRWVGTCTDVDDRKRAEEAVRASEQRYRELFEANPHPMYVYDTETLRFLAVNAAAVARYGYSRDEFLAMTVADIRPPGDVPKLLADLAKPADGLGPRGAWRHRWKDGTVREVEVHAHALRYGGRPTRLVLVSDVTERRRAEAELRRSADLLRAVADGTTDAIFVKDRDGRYLFFNPAAARLVGRPAGEVLGKDDTELFDPEGARRVMDRDRRVRESGRVETVEESLTAGGVTRTYLATKAPYRDRQGKVIGTVGVSRDVTEWRRLSAERDELLARLQMHVERLPLAYILFDADFRITDWNPAAEQIFGYSKAEVLAMDAPVERLVPPAARPVTDEVFRRIRAGDMDANSVNENLTKDGRTITCEWFNTPLFAEDGRFTGLLCLARDITARRASEEALRLRDQAIQAVTQGILITDPSRPDNPIVYASPGFERLTGYAPAEVLGKNCRFLQGRETDREAVARVREAVRAGQPCTVELRNYRKDGTPFWNELSVSPVRDGAGRLTHFVGVQADVTERRLLEEQYRQAQKMEAVGQLAGGVAHDFNNLLTIIQGYSDLLLQKLPPGDPGRVLAEEIHRAGERSAALTRQLLVFSRRQVVAPQVLDLGAVVADADKMLRRVIGEDVVLETPRPDGEVRVKADAGQLEQVLLNLAVNARDAMPRGGRLTIAVAAVELGDDYARVHAGARPGPHALLAVTDTGCGMPPEVRARIFEPFFTTKGPGKGTGLGLAVVHGIVKQAGGHVEVDTGPGAGTTFKVYLPRVERAAAPSRPASADRTRPRGTETVLLVEDEDGVRALTRHALAGCGYTVLEAAGGEEALRVAGQHRGPVHLLVTDVVMPGMGGRQVAERARALHPGAKVLYLSGYTDDAVVRHGVLQEDVQFLQKPFSLAALAFKVREVLDGR